MPPRLLTGAQHGGSVPKIYPYMTNRAEQQKAEVRYRVMRALESNPEITQRQLAEELGVSLGQVNYQLKALKDKGLVKLGNFIRNDNKLSYVHLLTPKGMTEKIKLTEAFLIRKREEFALLKNELKKLEKELEATHRSNSEPN